MLADPERRRSPGLREEIAQWLATGGTRQAVMFNAMQEWPRRPDLRPVYLAGVDRMERAVARAIEEDRRAGVAQDGPPSPQVAAGIVWVMERAWYGSIGGAEHLDDVGAVTAALADTFVAAIYGH
jgi:hypothetical protein